MDTIDRIRSRLNALSPARLEVIDESSLHAGHAGAVPGKTTHVRIHIEAEAFRGKSRIERHRAVTDLLKEEIDAGLHAIAIQAKVPDE